MRSLNILLFFSAWVVFLQSCGINNYFKAKNLREEIAAENKRTDNLIKKREAEFAKMQILKDSVRLYRTKLKRSNP
ncbi:MAG: hypothetical protein RLZZ161_1908 [Bacteroidota bacterium]|jgi:cell division protein FtsB